MICMMISSVSLSPFFWLHIPEIHCEAVWRDRQAGMNPNRLEIEIAPTKSTLLDDQFP